jgi:Tol biopolymer transport system component
MPDGEHILYASTHGASPECPPEPERSQGYTWPVHAGYDLYVTDLEGAEHKRLTTSDVYDAEGTVNWATGRIVYTSLESGDLELWSMGLDGKNKSKLTSGIGYDGGAVFSPDGRWLAWRAHHPLDAAGRMNFQDLLAQNLTAPLKMEIYVGDEYGMSAKKLTNTGCASFTPRFTADGKQIIFSSNMNNCDTREFELFIMEARGGNLEQVTRFYASTSTPAFSPDGKRISFTSSINAKDNSVLDIFVADWNQ